MNRLIFFFLFSLIICSCSTDDTMPDPVHPSSQLRIPISVMVGNGSATRVGDPGLKEEMPTPRHVYIFIWKKSNTSTYDFLFIRREDILSSKWTFQDEGSEYEECYQLVDAITITSLTAADLNPGFTKNEVIGRSYAIASNVKIPESELKSMVDGLYAGVFDFALTGNEYAVKNINETTYPSATLDAKIQAIEMDCNGWNVAEQIGWNTKAFRDLYSSPAKQDGRLDVLGIQNGLILYNDETYPGHRELHGDVRLYHAAAKVDFKWEVPAALRDKVAVKKLTTKNLPVKCKIFQPTSNPTTTTNKYIIGTDAEVSTAINKGTIHPINPGNKWAGREYFYVLQPAMGTISYTVDFEAVDGGTPKASVDATFTPTPLNNIFTGWFRINATIEE